MRVINRHFPTLTLLCLLPSILPAQDAAPATAAPATAAPVDAATAAAIRHEGIVNTQAMRFLQDLTGKVGHRLTGSDNFTRACYWALDEFTSMGISAHLEKWGEWKIAWNKGNWDGRVVSPVEMELFLATEAWTAGTKGPVRGKLVAFDDIENLDGLGDLEGAFLYGPLPRGDAKKSCIDRGIKGFVFAATGNEKYPNRIRVFGNSRIARGNWDAVPTVPEIAVRPDHAEKLSELLAGESDVLVEFDIGNRFREGPIELYNVVAEIPGTEKPEEVVIVCGHLDSWHQATGTTDNGTGATSTMEAARILAAVGAKPTRTVRFCLWGGEEQGLLGSGAYVKRHRAEMENVVAVFNHDTGTNWAHSMGVTPEMLEPMTAVFEPVMKLSAPDPDHDGPVFNLRSVESISGGGGSDHASFIAAGVPAWSWGLRGRSDYFGYTWHTQWDSIDVAVPEYQRHTATVVALTALGTANLPDKLDRSKIVRRGRRGQAGSYAGFLFQAEMDGFKFTKVEKDGRAGKMGIMPGDVLKKVNGKSIEQMFEIFVILRDDAPKELVFTLKRGEGQAEARMEAKMLQELMSQRQRGGNRGNRGGRQGAPPQNRPQQGGNTEPGKAKGSAGKSGSGSGR